MSKPYKEQQSDLERVKPFTHAFAARRAFLAYSLLVGTAAMLTACGGERFTLAEGNDGSCAGSTSLSLSQRANRTALSYVDVADNSEETCLNCRYFEQPQTGDVCGGCIIVSGAIASVGYCTAWAPIEI